MLLSDRTLLSAKSNETCQKYAYFCTLKYKTTNSRIDQVSTIRFYTEMVTAKFQHMSILAHTNFF